MYLFGMLGWMVGTLGFAMAAAALGKINKLEAELKKRGVIE